MNEAALDRGHIIAAILLAVILAICIARLTVTSSLAVSKLALVTVLAAWGLCMALGRL